MHKPLRTLVNAAVLSAIASTAYAGGFSLYTESGPMMTGNFGAGAAAEGADASIGWYNPAGLVLIHNQQAVFGGVGVLPVAQISGTSSYFSPLFDDTPYVETFNGLKGAKEAFVPSLHYALPLGDRATFGFSIVSPFGLATEWAADSAVRYQATFTEVITMNFSPEIGGKLTDNFAVGAGLDLQYARVKFNRMLGLPVFALPLGNPMVVDSLSYNKGDSFGVGFHAGILGMFNDNHTRIGLNYQSKMRHKFNGYSQLSGSLAGTVNLGTFP
ncbi:MAG: transporter, partial [Legionella sp.]